MPSNKLAALNFPIPSLEFAVTIMVVLLFLAALVRLIRSQEPGLGLRAWIHYAGIARYPLLSFIVLLLIGWVSKRYIDTLLGNLLILNTTQDVALVTWFALLLAWVCFFTLRTLARSAADRIGVLPRLVRPTGRVGSFVTGSYFFMLAALPLLVAVYRASDRLRPEQKALGILVGLALALLSGGVQRWLFDHTQWFQIRLHQRMARLPAWWTNDLFTGYQFGAGHGGSLLFFLLTLLLYGLGFVFLKPALQPGFVEPPALAWLLMLMVLLAWVLPGLAFFLDRFHIPVIMLLALYAVVVWWTGESDYYYPLARKEPTADSVNERLTPARVLRNWRAKHDDNLPLVIITASGGGIKAAVWTTSMLQALQIWLGDQFADHIVLLSSVSGGSVGVLHYLDRFEDDGPPTTEGLEAAVQASIRPSLADAAWGISYPDLLQRMAGSPTHNRGWALEQGWRRAMQYPDATLEDWRTAVHNGVRPPVLFNATIMDNGTLFAFTPLDEFEADQKRRAGEWHSVYFNTLYPTFTISVSTAARMSASFPYVSPIARPMLDEQPLRIDGFRLADGGYFDNYGIVAALEWLAAVNDELRHHPRRVILVRIEASLLQPESVRRASATSDLPNSIGAGPPLGALRSLFTAQKWRNDQAIEQLVAPQRAQQLSENLNRIDARLADVAVEPYTFVFTRTASLSWQLSQAESDRVRCAVEEKRALIQALCKAFYRDDLEASKQCEQLPTLVELNILQAGQCTDHTS
jgi:hypothetical protein